MKLYFVHRIPVSLILAAIFLLSFQSHCGFFKEDTDKNIILITLDTQRYDHISAHASAKAKTPHLDFFAENGSLFKNCYSLIPITVPAHAVIFYSLPPHELKIYNNGQILRTTKKTVSLPEIFLKHGYETAAFISLGVLDKRFGLGDGFQKYDDSLLGHRWYLTAEEINKKVTSWLSNNGGKKFFLWIHYSDPHFPYAPPYLPSDLEVYLNGQKAYDFCVQKVENISMSFPIKPGKNTIRFNVLNPFPQSRDEFRVSLNVIEFIHPESIQLEFEKTGFVSRGDKRSLLIKDEGFIQVLNSGKQAELTIQAQGNITLLSSEKTNSYQKEVEYMDHHIGLLTAKLKELGLLDKSILVIVGDHGEGLGEYETDLGEEHFGHIHYLHDVYMKIPLIIFNPFARKQGKEFEKIVSLLDLAPTIINLMGWEKIPFHQGRDLFRMKTRENGLLFEETYTPEAIHDCFAGLQYPWHLIFTPELRQFQLYDLESDPHEKHDVFMDEKDNETVVVLMRQVYNRALEILKNKRDIPIDDKSVEMLRALGYIK